VAVAEHIAELPAKAVRVAEALAAIARATVAQGQQILAAVVAVVETVLATALLAAQAL